MDTRDLCYFRLVYEERSINKAAAQLFITPQGLSRIIGKLESELQSKLFVRTVNGTQPTQAGDYLYTQSQELLYQMECLKQKMQQLSCTQISLRIGFACGSLNVLHLERLLQVAAMYPQLQLQWQEMENQEVIEKLRSAALDAGFIIGTNACAELEAETVYAGAMTALVYEGHPYYERQMLYIKDLQGEPLITLNQKYACYHNLLQRCSDFGFVPNIAISTMESSLIYDFCEKRIGIGIDADIHPTAKLPCSLHKIPIQDAIAWRISLVYRKNDHNTDILAKLRELCALR